MNEKKAREILSGCITERPTLQCEICGVSYTQNNFPMCHACYDLLWKVSREELTELVARVRKVERLRKPLEDLGQEEGVIDS